MDIGEFEEENFEEKQDGDFEFQEKNDNSLVQHDVEFVIIYGPPCSGKTLYYKQNYSQRNYVRVSPSELFSDSPSLSLHKVISVILRHLIEGRSVVLDDTTHTSLERTRRSYITAIKSKLSWCKFVAIHINCSLPQCLWAREFALAERTILFDLQGKTLSPIKYKEPELEQWFLHKSDPAMDEGYQEIREVSNYLTVNGSQNAYSNAGLFIDAKSILCVEDDQIAIASEAALVITEWKQQNVNGRVIVLVDESNLFPASIELIRDSPLQQKQKLDTFREYLRVGLQSLRLEFPIYYLRADYDILEPDHFFRPPKPGMIAWLQYRHKLDLAKCLYIDSFNSKKCGEIATSIGVSYCPSDLFWRSNSWTVASKIRKYARDTSINTPNFLKKIQYLSLPSNSTLKEPTNSLPLENHNKTMSEEFLKVNPTKLSIPCVEERGGVGRIHGVVFPGMHFRNSQTKVVSLLIQNENLNTHRTSTPKRRNLPEWMTGENVTPAKKRKSTKKTLSDSGHTYSNNSNSNSYDESSNDSQNLVPPKKLKLRHSYDSALTSPISSDVKIKQEPISLISPPSSPSHATPLRSISQSDSALYNHPSRGTPSQHESDYLTPVSMKQARSIHLDQLLDTTNENESNDSNDNSETTNISLQDLLQRHLGASSLSAFSNVPISRDLDLQKNNNDRQETPRSKKVSLKALLEL